MPPAPRLPVADLIVLAGYLAGIALLGASCLRHSRTRRDFTIAASDLPAWVVGLSIFATFLSSNTFLGVPGKAYGADWNAFVFSLSLPIAAWIAVRFFVPFHRGGGDVSAYAHLERRFGLWARVYAVACYLLTQLARMGTIMFGTALGLHALTGWRLETLILLIGLVATLYTVLGGIRAVIWTDVVQGFVLMGGALAVFLIILARTPGGPANVIDLTAAHGKFSLGSLIPDPRASTFWVVLLYGLFINLANFGIDQNYVQRYHAAQSDRAAARSVWLGALLYVPVSLVFFMIGTALYAFYHSQPSALNDLMVRQGLSRPDDVLIADRAFPHFIATQLPPGLAGLVTAAVLAAAMSTIDTSLNSSATVYLNDVHQRFFARRPAANPLPSHAGKSTMTKAHGRPAVGFGGKHAKSPNGPGTAPLDDRRAMRILHAFTVVWGVCGTAAALAMIEVRGILDAWWKWSGIFAGAMLGLFLLGILSRRAGSLSAAVAAALGVAVICWMTFSPGSMLPPAFQNPLHDNTTIVVGTLAILGAGFVLPIAFAGRRRTIMHAPATTQSPPSPRQ